MEANKIKDFLFNDDRLVVYRDRVCVPDDKGVRETILAEAHRNKRSRPIKFMVGDHIFLKVTPMTRIGRSIRAKKLTPRFIGPFKILERIGPLEYWIALPPHLSGVHDVFHVSQLKKYQPDPSHVIEPKDVELCENLTYWVKLEKIVDVKEKQLRNKTIRLVKVI
ncbi:uncharacterized protein LOC129305431 [Prosopis cineraria]|uniref:uncharacterized protein LOC129305431 n=1 Tax=Prosopis cineraria TaxID=364024 RepID=UPI00240EA590|nr:uncharacterized protein LOC129305431 [Prosopis cineraria]